MEEIPSTGDIFTSEHKGLRAPYYPADAVEANSYHGYVVEALKTVLQEYNPVNDRLRDLCIKDSNKRIMHLFEVKTSIDLQSIYTAIGQLFLNSDASTLGKFLVMLEHNDNNLLTKIKGLGVTIIPFKWEGHTVIFTEKAKLLKLLSQQINEK